MTMLSKMFSIFYLLVGILIFRYSSSQIKNQQRSHRYARKGHNKTEFKSSVSQVDIISSLDSSKRSHIMIYGDLIKEKIIEYSHIASRNVKLIYDC